MRWLGKNSFYLTVGAAAGHRVASARAGARSVARTL